MALNKGQKRGYTMDYAGKKPAVQFSVPGREDLKLRIKKIRATS